MSGSRTRNFQLAGIAKTLGLKAAQ